MNIEFKDSRAKEALLEAGWFENRQINIDDWLASLQKEGYIIFPLVKDVLKSFGGLEITPRPVSGAKFWSGKIILDPIWAASGERSRLEQREQELGCLLCPIGEWSGEYILLIADTNKVFAETTFQMLQLGNCFDEAIENIILCNKDLRDITH
jgi:hypothetical protein